MKTTILYIIALLLGLLMCLDSYAKETNILVIDKIINVAIKERIYEYRFGLQNEDILKKLDILENKLLKTEECSLELKLVGADIVSNIRMIQMLDKVQRNTYKYNNIQDVYNACKLKD